VTAPSATPVPALADDLGRPPPPRHGGPLAWARRHLFAGPGSTVATLLALALLAVALPPLLRWAVIHPVWRADYEACQALDHQGACWGFVAEKHRLVLFGRYPYAEQWRPLAATLLVVLMLLVSGHPRAWRGWILGAWAAALAGFVLLMGGGVPGLTPVGTERWGGLPLTVLLTLVAVGVSIPIGVALALARRSTLPLLRAGATLYIELTRGVPLITVLFVATFVFPLVLPKAVQTDALGRILIALTLFQSAYMAEVVRGGLQALPRGQLEAASSLGLSWWQAQRKVILPQALVLVIPSFVNSLLSTFMDTSLVTVVSMYDLTGSLRLALGDPQWRNFFLEGYLFVGAVYLVCCLAMSRYGQWLEGHLGRWARREARA
jgi:general L-amino acid transport system permease protein